MKVPVFIGGSGKSGTTIVGKLLSQHSAYAGIPFELRVHLATNPLALARRKRPTQWFHGHAVERFNSNLHQIVERKRYEQLVAEYLGQSGEPTANAARRFVEGIMSPVASVAEKQSWVDMTPANALHANWLRQVFPDMKLVHMLRDGRDVSISVSRSWRTMSPSEALEWWHRRVKGIASQLARLPGEMHHTISFERLAVTDRKAAYTSLIEFLGIEDEPAMREFFEETLTDKRANVGHWRRELHSRNRDGLAQQYVRVLASLRENAVTAKFAHMLDECR